MSLPETHLPAALEAAIIRVKATVVTVAERVATSVGTQAQSATRIMERDLLLATQIDLRRKINTFHLTFTETLTEKIRQEVLPRHDGRRKLASADWQTLTLVEDHEVEERMFSERIGQQISHASEWELREVAAYMGSVLGLGRAEEDRNPLRADMLGAAIYRAIESITTDHDARKLLAREFGQFMAVAMPECYKSVVREMQDRNVRPVNLTLKTVEGPGNQIGGHSGYASIHDDPRSTRSGETYGGGGDPGDSSGRGSLRARGPGLAGLPGGGAGGSVAGGSAVGPLGAGSAGRSGAATRHGAGPTGGGAMAGAPGQPASAAQADVQLMSLLRRLTFLASRPGGLDAGGSAGGGIGSGARGAGAAGLLSSRGGVDVALGTGPGGVGEVGGAPATHFGENLTGLMAVNLIRAHREELMQASSGKLDHMVIDVVGSLFDQILSDPRVPPQMARQIARLQLPVLRVALVDSTFFSSRRHPVRRFVNRIGSLACAFDEFDAGPGKQLLERVRALVQQIVEGDFDQLDVYTQKLAELESFISQATHQEAEANGAAGLLEAKESELRIQQRYMLKLQQSLDGISMPPYLREFTAQVWSQALVQAARRGGNSDLAVRFKGVGRDLVMSVQPKGSTVLRKKFLMQLPTLMKDLNEGMKLIGWPEAAQKEFFAKLLPSHAESLKAPPMSELEHNLLAKQLEGIFAAPIPAANDFARAEPVMEMPSEAMEQQFTPEEAQKIGLVEESAVDWSGEVDIDLSFEAMDAPDTNVDPHPGSIGADGEPSTVPGDLVQHIGVDINLDLATPDPTEITRGPQLIDHIKLGFAYQMLLKEEWQKVRLNYVSPGRSFFVFSRGRKHQETISLTSRMLARMCESGRLRAVESAYLMERATARARRQLAALKPSSARH